MVRQKEEFLILMDNQLKLQQALNIAQDSAGLGAERYAVYLKSIEAAQARVTVAWQELASSGATKDMIVQILDLTTAFINLINKIGGLKTVIITATTLALIFKAAWIQTTVLAIPAQISAITTALVGLFVPTIAATAAVEGLAVAEGEMAVATITATVAALPFVAALAAIAAGIYLVIKANQEFEKSEQDKIEAIKNKRSAVIDSIKTYEEYVSQMKKASDGTGILFDEEGRAFRAGGHGVRTYVSELDILTKAKWNLLNATERIDKGEKDNIATIETAISSYQNLSTTISGLTTTKIDDLMEKSIKGGLDFTDIPNIPPEYMDALNVVGDKLKLNVDIIKQTQLEQIRLAKVSVETALIQGTATQEAVNVITLMYNEALAQTQNTFGAFNQTAASYQELIWTIANDAEAAGFQFQDMEGKALTSAQNIFEYMSQGDAQFNTVVTQIAEQTGQSVAQVMNMINQMVAQTANNLNSLVGLGVGSQMHSEAALEGMLTKAGAQPLNIFSGYTPPVYGGGGGGGGETPKQKRERLHAERMKEIEKEIADARKAATDALKNQLNVYKDMIDARKKILDSLATERSYQQDLVEKQTNVANIQNQISELSLDTSAEAKAKILALQEDLRKAQQDLENVEYAHSTEAQKSALDAEYKLFEDKINAAISAVAGINANSVGAFAKKLAEIMASLGTMPTYHSGGIVGGKSASPSGEIVAKLMKGEGVFTASDMDNFMSKTLPNIMMGSPSVKSRNGGMTIGKLMEITVNGALDSSVIPDIQKIADSVVKKLNDNMLIRGSNRTVGLFSQ